MEETGEKEATEALGRLMGNRFGFAGCPAWKWGQRGQDWASLT